LAKSRKNFDDVTSQGSTALDKRTRPQAREHMVKHEASLRGQVMTRSAIQQINLCSTEAVAFQYVPDIIQEAGKLGPAKL
jgi:hypothetical protein